MHPHNLHLRRATGADKAFCYQVKKAAIGPYVTQVWGWDEEFQKQFHDRVFEVLQPQVVAYGVLDIGTIDINQQSDHIHLGEFYLLPQFQRQGIGSILLQRVIEQAELAHLPVRLEVLKVNPAQALYKRHGFVVVGEREHHFLMERAAPPQTLPESGE